MHHLVDRPNHTYTNHESGIIVTDLTEHFGVFHITYDTTNKTESTYIYVRQLKDRHIKKSSRIFLHKQIFLMF